MAEIRKSRSYKDLEAWQVSLELVKAIYRITGNFSSSERFGLTRQMRRAAVSIPSEVVEGQFRNSPQEFKQFIASALGSAAQLETPLIIAHDLSEEESTS